MVPKMPNENFLKTTLYLFFAVPNDNYCKFEDWVIPIFDQMLREQNESNINWTPSKMIHRCELSSIFMNFSPKNGCVPA